MEQTCSQQMGGWVHLNSANSVAAFWAWL